MQGRLDAIWTRIRETRAHGVTLIAVSKFQEAAKVREAYDCGVRHFGENYVQELLDKAGAVACPDLAWHFIGNIQSGKIKALCRLPSLFAVHTLASEKHARLFQQHRDPADQRLKVFLQVNTSGEASKGGLHDYGSLSALARFVVAECPLLELHGLMCIPSPASPQKEYETLAEWGDRLAAQLHLKLHLSMGMSDDYPLALAAGSDYLRIGSTIFGPRIKNT